ncbi:Ohr family peroxiredoxin [Spiroplasma culicicola]|uniref:OsmC/Ohr family protein n=1 Tax=Spiroplasma culicicola AES-1 TaxID=1276246 RepID=W6A7R4_9MOLU|nr:Ohr family peroxiredoxin [Spiroplasma culicicola]AHI52910.1 OsmC/Ohr family protein [Spiroplasma culicicola AES-1]
MKKIYEAVIKNTGGRDGYVISPDETFKYKITAPGVKTNNSTNPEQLFAAGYSSCFNGALQLVMKLHNNVHPSTITAKVSLFEDDKTGFTIQVVLEVKIEDIDHETATKFVAEADQVCPYSKAIKNNVKVDIIVL